MFSQLYVKTKSVKLVVYDDVAVSFDSQVYYFVHIVSSQHYTVLLVIDLQLVFKVRSLGLEWQPTPVFLPRKSLGWRSLAAYRPWGAKSQT